MLHHVDWLIATNVLEYWKLGISQPKNDPKDEHTTLAIWQLTQSTIPEHLNVQI